MGKKKQKNEITPLDTTVITASPERAKLPVKIVVTLSQYLGWSHFISRKAYERQEIANSQITNY